MAVVSKSSSMRQLALAVVLLSATLAGCAGPAPDGDGGSDADPRAMELPVWELGEWWRFRLDVPGFETQTVRITYAWDKDDYMDTRGWKHMMLGGPRDHAVFHAIFDINPFLGRIHSDVLSPHEDGLHSTIFDFPLEPPGETWEEAPEQVFFGKQRSFESTFSESVPSPDGPTEGYEIVATADDGSTVTYNYVPEVKWFTEMHVTDGDGDPVVDIQVLDHGFDSKDKAYFVRPRVLKTIDRDVSTGLDQQETFRVNSPSDYEGGDVYGRFEYLAVGVRVRPQGDVGRVDLSISDPDGTERWSGTVQSDQGTTEEVVRIDTASGDAVMTGEWTVTIDALNSAHLWLEANGAWEFCGRDGEQLQCP